MIIATPIHVKEAFVIIRVELLNVLRPRSIVAYVYTEDKGTASDLRQRIMQKIEAVKDCDVTINNARILDTLLSQTQNHEVYTIIGKLENVNAIRPVNLGYEVSHTSGEKPDWMKYVTDEFV